MSNAFKTGVVAFLLAIAALVSAQSFPQRPIKIIIPYAPGGGTDTAARHFAPTMAEIIGQPVIVENRPGATSIIGTAAVARAPADGYTIVIIDDTFVINSITADNLPYNSDRDFVPVASLLKVPLMLVVPADFPATSLQEFVAVAKARPGALNYASLGPTGSGALALRWLSHLAGIKMTAIPYQGLAPAMTSVMSNQTQVMLAGLTSGLAHVNSGRLKVIAVSTPARVPLLPNVASISEVYPGFDVTPWYGVLAPAGTPRDVVEKLNRAIRAAMNAPDVRERFEKTGIQPWVSTPDEFGNFLQSNKKLWANVVKIAGTTE